MTIDSSQSLDSTVFLHNILALLSQNTATESVIGHLLEYVQSLTACPAVFYVIFEKPRKVVALGIEEHSLPTDNYLFETTSAINDGLFMSNQVPHSLRGFGGWLIIPIRQRDRLMSALYVLFEQDVVVSDEQIDLLMSVMDALSLVTREAKVANRHETLMRNQNEFVRIVSHDLRSPLTSIQGFASMLESKMVGELNERQLHYIRKILSGVTQMTSLVENIQDAGRYDPETGFYDIERAPVDVVEIAKRVVKNHLLPAEKSELTLLVDVSDAIPIINADANMIERSMINLVDNAIKYTPNGGKIEVGVHLENEQIIISVKDNGLGISPEDLKQLFQRHFRIRRPEHKLVKGSGLGLFIVRSVALRHGGDAFVESVEGQGSTFGIIIPLRGENLLASRE